MITPEQLNTIAQQAAKQPLNETMIATLRQTYPDLHFTYCMDDDLPNQSPILECGAFNLYLVDGREHCLCLTQDYQNATGIVIAEIITD